MKVKITGMRIAVLIIAKHSIRLKIFFCAISPLSLSETNKDGTKNPRATPSIFELAPILVEYMRSFSPNQLADSFAGALKVKGKAIASIVYPTITKAKCTLIKHLNHRPRVYKLIAMITPILSPHLSIIATDGKLTGIKASINM